MYKPKFCCDCGEQITRARWHIWTSRHFCSLCAGRFQRTRILLPLIASATLFSFGLIIGRAMRSSPPPLIIERAPLTTDSAQLASAQNTETEPSDNSETAAQDAKPQPAYGSNGTPTEKPTEPDEIVSFCGARTKKGTPCQRRVHGTGRCWQHIGMPAMIPLEKRILTGKVETAQDSIKEGRP